MQSEQAPPAHWECDVVLADGGTVHVRPIRPDDADALVVLHAGLSDETVLLRFFGPKPALDPVQADHFTTVDHVDRVALVAELGDRLVAVARYDRVPGSDSAEVAFVVSDAHQGRGIGTALWYTWPRRLASEASPGSSPPRSCETAGCSGCSAARASKRPRSGRGRRERRAADRTDRGLPGRHGAARTPGRGGICRPAAQTQRGGRDRRESQSADRGPPGTPQPARRRIRRNGLSGQSEGRERCERQGVPDHQRCPRHGRPRDRCRPRGSGDGHRASMWGDRRGGCGRAHRRVRRGGAGG